MMRVGDQSGTAIRRTVSSAAVGCSARTAPIYRLFALAGGGPARPGMIRSEPGEAVDLEVWTLPAEGLADFLASVPPPLSIGTITLADGSRVKGFLVENAGLDGAEEITKYGGWRAYLAAGKA